MAKKCIVYTNSEGKQAVITPVEGLLSVEEVAAKDVPEGIEFQIVDVNEWLATPPDPVELAVALAALRERTSITRRDFCMGLRALGVLTPQDAVAAAKGDWPSAMDAFLTFLSPAQATDVQIEWAAAPLVWRTNVFVLTLASWLEMTDADLDGLFGINAQVEAV